LSGNYCGEEGMKYLIQCLNENVTLTTIKLPNISKSHSSSKEYTNSVEEICKRNESKRKIVFRAAKSGVQGEFREALSFFTQFKRPRYHITNKKSYTLMETAKKFKQDGIVHYLRVSAPLIRLPPFPTALRRDLIDKNLFNLEYFIHLVRSSKPQDAYDELKWLSGGVLKLRLDPSKSLCFLFP
jgi:hypothetical protein